MDGTSSNSKNLTLKRTTQYALVLLNLVALGFMLVYVIVHKESAAANVFAWIAFATICLNMIYGALTKRKGGFWLILLTALCLGLNMGLFWLVGLFDAAYPLRILGSAVMIIIPSLAILVILSDMRGREQKPERFPRFVKFTRYALSLLLLACLILFAWVGYDNVFKYEYSTFEYLISRVEVLFPLLSVAVFCGLLRFIFTDAEGSFRKKMPRFAAVLVVCLPLMGMCFFGMFRGYFALPEDITAAQDSYFAAFNESAQTHTEPGMRQTVFNLADIWFGIDSKGYKAEKDIIYYQEAPGDPRGLQLAYDVYYPAAADAHKSVLVLIHGAGNDKGYRNSPHMNRYFASRGYVVYDIQVGSSAESNTNYPGINQEDIDRLQNIDRFFTYAKNNNSYGANFDSVFLGGLSMGGFLSCDYALEFENSLTELGIQLRGIIPLYGGNAESVTKESPSCLMYWGSHDGVVSPNLYYQMQELYAEAQNPGFVGVWVSNGRHGCDGAFASRPSQILIYFMERFMDQLR